MKEAMDRMNPWIKAVVLAGAVACVTLAAGKSSAAPPTLDCSNGSGPHLNVTYAGGLFQTRTAFDFENISGAKVHIALPENQPVCVKIRLTAQAQCITTRPEGTCQIRAKGIFGPVPVQENGRVLVAPGSPAPVSFIWLPRVNPDIALDYDVQMQVQAHGIGTVIKVQNWVLEAEVYYKDGKPLPPAKRSAPR
jgi:hypothetical protein